MATTDSRTGFRLPWSTDRAASREASADPAEATAAPTEPEAIATSEADATSEAGATVAPEPGLTTDHQDASGDAVPGQQEEPVPTLAPDAAPPAAVAPASQPNPGGQGRRPTKFLADLTRAMQAAAEQARIATLDQFRADGTTVIEQIHARSSTDAVDLRRRADDDVAAIKEWSKAEIARVREETERRIGARREQLEGQLERHAALIEHEIEKVRGRLASFEAEMGGFFDDLVGEEDPAVFAARAASMPEPPSFDDLEEDALASLLDEPGVGVPASVAEVTGPVGDPVAESAGEAPLQVAEPEPETPAEPESANPVPIDMSSLDREAAIAAIAAAAEAAAALEVAEPPADDAETPADEAEASGADAEPASAPEPEAVTEVQNEPEMAAEPEAGGDAEATGYAEPEVDPRLAMLGLTPDFAAAEAAAAEAAASEVEDVPEIGGEALAARLSGLVPADTAAEPATPPVTTQVVTTGLVSVASIASFKRHLGRLAGVAHVGVSSGPDGEFVFAVDHDPTASLRDLVPTLPGFAARVVASGEGILQVSAQDPQD